MKEVKTEMAELDGWRRTEFSKAIATRSQADTADTVR